MTHTENLSWPSQKQKPPFHKPSPLFKHERKNTNRKPSPLVGKQANHFSGSKERIGNACCPRLSGKVSAELTKGESVSRYVKKFLTKRYYMPACHSWTVVKSWFDRDGINRIASEWRIWQRIQDLNILTNVLRLAPFASQGPALPSMFGERLFCVSKKRKYR